MRKEPLKGREWKGDVVPHGWHMFERQDIKSAVEWLKEHLWMDEKHGGGRIFVNENDILELIDEAFEDVV